MFVHINCWRFARGANHDDSIGTFSNMPIEQFAQTRQIEAAIVEHDGSVYSCDHFMYPDYRLGNLRDETLESLMTQQAQIAFGAAKEEQLPRMCQTCQYRFACHGECPKNRFIKTPDGEPGLNYLCPSYLKFFRHITPTMNAMAKLVQNNQPAALIRDALKGPLIIKLHSPT